MGAADRAAGVNIFPEADELDVELIEFIEDFQEVPDRAGDAIERPDHDDIELAAASIGQEMIEPGALCLHPGDFVAVFLHDLETALRNEAAQIVQLGFKVLIGGGDTNIQGRAFHQRRPFFTAAGKPFG
jgi:hypothetical protein